MASIAERRCVGVYSSNREIKSIAFGSALRKTYLLLDTDHTRDREFEYLAKRMRLDLWEFVLHIIRIHSTNLITCRRAEDFNDFHELVNSRLSREEWLPEHQLGHNATS